MSDKKNIHQKMVEAISNIRTVAIRKDGNGYNFKYLTPERIDSLIFQATKKLGIYNQFTLQQTELGIKAVLTITNTDNPNDTITSEIISEIPDNKGMNRAQAIGSAITYSRRYLLSAAYFISDNSLDIDSLPVSKKELKENSEAYKKVVKALKSGNYKIEQVEEKYKLSDELKAKLNEAI